MSDLTSENERINIEFSKEELDDLIGHLRTGKRLRPGHPRQQRLLAKLRGFGPADGGRARTPSALWSGTPRTMSPGWRTGSTGASTS